jgi:hypothetical protein
MDDTHRLLPVLLLLSAWLMDNSHAAANSSAATTKFTLGYLTGSSRRPTDKEYSRPGLLISGESRGGLFFCQ